jgi:NADH dehydrogenase
MAIRRIAVTGANGFVGRQLTLAASAQGCEVVGIVRSEAGARAVAQAGGRPVRLAELEVEPLAEAVAGSAALVHLAQIGSEREGSTYDVVNLGLTRTAAAAARRAAVPRVVYFSGLGVAHYAQLRRCTNPYFLSKLSCELELYRSGREVAVFRPSYVVGPGSGLIPELLREMDAGAVELIGDGGYRLQPIAVRDAADAILAAVERQGPHPAAFDLVGPEPITYRDFVARVARAGARLGFRTTSVSVAEADRQAAAGGYRGMMPDELDCLLCDEVADARPLEALLGRFLTPLDEALLPAVRAVR